MKGRNDVFKAQPGHQVVLFPQSIGERNSYTKTDEDATFKRLKEDHLKNGPLKPAYNMQISTEGQLITNFSLHRRPGDTATLIPRLEQFASHHQTQSPVVVADAGYGSEHNYAWLEEHQPEAFVKYKTSTLSRSAGSKQTSSTPSTLTTTSRRTSLSAPWASAWRR